MLPFTFRQLLIVLLVGTVLLSRAGPRTLGGIGLVLLALGAATFRVELGPVAPGALEAHLGSGALPESFIAGTLALMGLGTVLSAAAAGVMLARVRAPLDWPAAGLMLVASGVFGWSLWPAVQRDPVPVLSAAALILAGGVALYWIGRLLMLGTAIRWLDQAWFRPRSNRQDPWRSVDLVALGLTAGGMLAAVAAQRVEFVLGGALLAALAAQLLELRRGRSRLPLLPLLAAAGLVPALWLIRAIAGPTGLTLHALPAGPFSPAAETLLVLLLAIGALGFLALWPLERWLPGAALAPIGAALLLRIAVPALPAGLVHWQPLLDAVALISLWAGAVLRRPAPLLAGATLLAAATGAGGGVAGAGWLALSAAVAGVTRWTTWRPAPLVQRLLWCFPAWGGLLALDGLLRTQVVFGVLAAAAVAVAIRVGGRSGLRLHVDPPPGPVHIPPAIR